jgi:hypothetical protein
MTDLTNSRYVTLGQTAACFSADPDVQFRQVHGLTVCKNFTNFTFSKKMNEFIYLKYNKYNHSVKFKNLQRNKVRKKPYFSKNTKCRKHTLFLSKYSIMERYSSFLLYENHLQLAVAMQTWRQSISLLVVLTERI